MSTTRRRFLARTSLALAGVTAQSLATSAHAAQPAVPKDSFPLIISTWPFGKPANEAALRALLNGGSLLDGVEQGIRLTESDPKNTSVGMAGTPNAAGVVQLDACIMLGPGHKAGGVAGVEGIPHPISAARRVLEHTPHVLLVGEGARVFAIEQGLESIPTDGGRRLRAWQRKRARERKAGGGSKQTPANHDTIALLVLGRDGNVAGGCSTSGLGNKLPGRVGDSPIIGSGLYVDNDVGAAGATGIGENVMRYCGSFMVVELMRQGLHPEEACLEAIRRIAKKDPRGMDLKINFIALDRQGRYGGAGSAAGFQYAVAWQGVSRIETGPGAGTAPIGPVGGNQP